MELKIEYRRLHLHLGNSNCQFIYLTRTPHALAPCTLRPPISSNPTTSTAYRDKQLMSPPTVMHNQARISPPCNIFAIFQTADLKAFILTALSRVAQDSNDRGLVLGRG